jgi:hypothetical protein
MQFLKNVWQLLAAVGQAGSAKVRSCFQPGEGSRRRAEIERLDRIRHPDKYLGK